MISFSLGSRRLALILLADIAQCYFSIIVMHVLSSFAWLLVMVIVSPYFHTFALQKHKRTNETPAVGGLKRELSRQCPVGVHISLVICVPNMAAVFVYPPSLSANYPVKLRVSVSLTSSFLCLLWRRPSTLQNTDMVSVQRKKRGRIVRIAETVHVKEESILISCYCL